jgi:hypothetical protein
MMRRFTSAPKPSSRDRSYISRSVSCAESVRAVPVAHAVVAREVRTRLRGGDEVVDRNGEECMRERDVDDARAEPRQASMAAANALCDRWHPPFDERARHADAQALACASGRAAASKTGAG